MRLNLNSNEPYFRRVIAISSGGMLIEPLDTTDIALEKLDPFDGVAAYSRTKRQQVALTEKFADVYKDTPVSFYSMHPGWVSPTSAACHNLTTDYLSRILPDVLPNCLDFIKLGRI